MTFRKLPGWSEGDHAPALEAFLRSCSEIISEGRAFRRSARFGGARDQWLEACTAIPGPGSAREFFETSFTVFEVIDHARPNGLFTGYYEPEAEGSLQPTREFSVPIYRKPDDLLSFSDERSSAAGLSYGRIVEGAPKSYFTRQEIESGALAGRGLEIVWLRDWADAFFMHVQGSGRVRLADGQILRLGYAMKSGLAYTSIGAILVDRGAFTREQMSMQSIRTWMAEHPDEARQLMWMNESFVFFRALENTNPGLGPLGAQQVPLTPGHSLAVDRALWMFGTPVWLDTTVPAPGGMETFRRLLIAQDTGSAIKGAARGDVFWGAGGRAAAIAGRMKSSGRMFVLLPNALAKNVAAGP